MTVNVGLRGDKSAILEVKDMKAGYGSSEVLHGINFAMNAGDAVAIIGPNGAGKSTLLTTIAGLRRTYGGSILFRGAEVQNLRTSQRVRQGLILVPEGRQVFPTLTVSENLWLGGFTARDSRDESTAAALDLFPALARRLTQRAGTLSGGEQQMLAIARGLIARPKLLMVDEPSLGLAPVLLELLVERLRVLRDQFEVSMLIAEQGIALARDVCEVVHVLAAGRLVATVSPDASREEVHELYLGGDVISAQHPEKMLLA
jgi:branched-chain amino acid transport system ATP-binding protein